MLREEAGAALLQCSDSNFHPGWEGSHVPVALDAKFLQAISEQTKNAWEVPWAAQAGPEQVAPPWVGSRASSRGDTTAGKPLPADVPTLHLEPFLGKPPQPGAPSN